MKTRNNIIIEKEGIEEGTKLYCVGTYRKSKKGNYKVTPYEHTKTLEEAIIELNGEINATNFSFEMSREQMEILRDNLNIRLQLEDNKQILNK